MQDGKDITWQSDYHGDGEAESKPGDRDGGTNSAEQNEADGWQQYRRWISKAPAPRNRRTGVDPSLYTWKGYRNWTEQVKRNWSDN